MGEENFLLVLVAEEFEKDPRLASVSVLDADPKKIRSGNKMLKGSIDASIKHILKDRGLQEGREAGSNETFDIAGRAGITADRRISNSDGCDSMMARIRVADVDS